MPFINLLLSFVYITYFYWYRREQRPIFNIYLGKKNIYFIGIII